MKILIIANIFGALALMLEFLGTQAETKNKVMLYNGLSNVMCIIQYLILGALTGAISCVIAVLRNIAFSLYKEKIPIYILIIYLIILFGFNFMFCKDFISFIPVIATSIYGICLYQSNVKVLKVGTIFVDAIGTIFDFYTKAYATMAKCLFAMFGGIIGYLRYIKENKDDSVKLR